MDSFGGLNPETLKICPYLHGSYSKAFPIHTNRKKAGLVLSHKWNWSRWHYRD